jgi:hypothetical protein
VIKLKVIINADGEITRIISGSSIPQQLKEGEFELETNDPKLIDAFNKGYEILYNKKTGLLHYETANEIDPEKVALYEAVANLFEEVQALKNQIGGAE